MITEGSIDDYLPLMQKSCLEMAANHDEVDDLILAYNDAGVIDVDEALILQDVQERKNPQFPYWTYNNFDLDVMEEDECKADFRMRKKDVLACHRALRYPELLKCCNRVVVDSIEALCIFLRWLAFPCRYGDFFFYHIKTSS